MQSIIKKDQVCSVAAGTAPPKSAGDSCQKGVRLLAEGGLAHAIEITCSCGEVTVVELDYSAGSESNQ